MTEVTEQAHTPVILFSLFLGTSQMFSEGIISSYITISNLSRLQFLHVLSNACYYLLFAS